MVRDALRLAAVLATFPVSRRPVRPLPGEVTRSLPGDELVGDAKIRWSHAITIRAHPADIWPWLVQMGCRRAGWYSYDGLDNGGVPSAARIVPELQRVRVGDIFPMTPKAEDRFVVRAVEPARALVLGDAAGQMSWAFVLEPVDEASTRLITRSRGAIDRLVLGLMLRVFWHPLDFGMQRRQLLNLKRLVESARRGTSSTRVGVGTERLALERLTPLDVSNLRIEGHGLPMNVAALAVLEGRGLLDASGELDLEAIRARIGQRLQLAPRLRQRLYRPGFGLGAPVWADDADFDIGRHVGTRHIPAGGGEEALLAACVELNARPFDQAHPLWEMWLLTGTADGRVAMLIRFHHVLADGMAALLLLGTLFDAAPVDSSPEAPESQGSPWAARPVPARSELLGDELRRSITGLRRGLDKIEHPRRTVAPASTFFHQALQLAREGRAPSTSLNRPVSRQHHVLLVRADLEQARQVAHAHNATINDVVLCTIAGGARALLASRGELPRRLELKVSVAASVRAATSTSQAGNLVGVLIVPVPVDEEDPIRRLEQIARATAERKRLPPYQPAARLLQRWMIRTMNRQRRINLLMSNLPGPPQPMYFAGAKILELFQIGVVQGNVAVQVGALSYAGQLNLDIVADASLVPDLTVFAAGMTEDLKRMGATPHDRE